MNTCNNVISNIPNHHLPICQVPLKGFFFKKLVHFCVLGPKVWTLVRHFSFQMGMALSLPLQLLITINNNNDNNLFSSLCASHYECWGYNKLKQSPCCPGGKCVREKSSRGIVTEGVVVVIGWSLALEKWQGCHWRMETGRKWRNESWGNLGGDSRLREHQMIKSEVRMSSACSNQGGCCDWNKLSEGGGRRWLGADHMALEAMKGCWGFFFFVVVVVVVGFILAMPCGMWDLSFLTRDSTCAPCSGSSEP